MQTQLPHRHGDWADLGADAFGTACGLLLATALRRSTAVAAPKTGTLGRTTSSLYEPLRPDTVSIPRAKGPRTSLETTMTQATLELDTPAADAADRTGFDIGWDHAHHGLVPPAELLHEGTPVCQGWLAGRAVFGRRTLATHAHDAPVAAVAHCRPGATASPSKARR